uniref:5'-nucleotidase, cytosolic IIa n=1 Tax=Neogobius melanostomus TaxID=47308 RepID=A0A8C6U0F1_9GOBI
MATIRGAILGQDYRHLHYVKLQAQAVNYTQSILSILTFTVNLQTITLNYICYPLLLSFVYDPMFPIRGLVFDTLYGNQLKVDTCGNILVYTVSTLKGGYYVKSTFSSFISCYYVIPSLNTCLDLPETYHPFTYLVDFFSNCSIYSSCETGFKDGDLFMSYKICCQRSKASSSPDDYKYTEKMMTYIFDFPSLEGTVLRQVDTTSGRLKITPARHCLLWRFILCVTMGFKGKDTSLYWRPHFGDNLKSKKRRGWRTFLVMPEPAQELLVWTNKSSKLYMKTADVLMSHKSTVEHTHINIMDNNESPLATRNRHKQDLREECKQHLLTCSIIKMQPPHFFFFHDDEEEED